MSDFSSAVSLVSVYMQATEKQACWKMAHGCSPWDPLSLYFPQPVLRNSWPHQPLSVWPPQDTGRERPVPADPSGTCTVVQGSAGPSLFLTPCLSQGSPHALRARPHTHPPHLRMSKRVLEAVTGQSWMNSLCFPHIHQKAPSLSRMWSLCWVMKTSMCSKYKYENFQEVKFYPSPINVQN